MGRGEVLRTGRYLAPQTSVVSYSWPTVLLLMSLCCCAPKALGIRTQVLGHRNSIAWEPGHVFSFVPKGPGDQEHSFAWKLWCGFFPGGGGFWIPVRKPLVASQLTCVTLHDSYWQLVHFIPPPFSPIELVVVLYSFHGIGALMRRKPLSVS